MIFLTLKSLKLRSKILTKYSFPGPASLLRQLTAPVQWQQGAQGALPVELSPGDHQATFDPLMTVLSACVETLTKPLTPQAPSGRLFQQLTESSQS